VQCDDTLVEMKARDSFAMGFGLFFANPAGLPLASLPYLANVEK